MKNLVGVPLPGQRWFSYVRYNRSYGAEMCIRDRVSYRGRDYMIADPNDPASPQNQYWNRDMFRLINALTSQVTVDISKFPIPEILQLHSD